MILVDSSVWIDYFRGVATWQTDRLDALLGTEPLLIGDVILTEVLQGFTSDHDFDHALRLLTSLTIVDIGGRDIAIKAARNFRALRARGVTIRKTIDTLIASAASRTIMRFCTRIGISIRLSSIWGWFRRSMHSERFRVG